MNPGPSAISATKPLGPCQVGDSVIFVASYPAGTQRSDCR